MLIDIPPDTLEIIRGIISVARVLFIVFALFQFGFIIWAIFNTNYFRRLFLQDLVEVSTFKPYGVRNISREWREIRKRLERESDSEYKLAVIDSDAILADILDKMGFSGNSLGEQLDQITDVTLPSLAKVREAHAVRNNIVHDPDFRLGLEQARGALSIYEQAFKELEAL